MTVPAGQRHQHVRTAPPAQGGEAAVDAGGVPLQNIRIKHTLVLENPFLDDGGNEGGEERFICRDASPPSQGPFGDNGRLEDNWRPAAKEEDKKNKKKRKKKEDGDDESDGGGDDDDSGEENSGDDDEVASIAAAAARRREGAAARAVVLEMVGDLPAADVAPPETVLFVCKLNPITREQDLEVVFGRFGRVVSCDVVRDGGASLGYAFVGFETRAAAESAYLKMNNVLLDDRRIKVDFSQSVGHLWKRFKSGGGGRGGGGRSAGGRGSGGGGRGQQQRQGGLLPPHAIGSGGPAALLAASAAALSASTSATTASTSSAVKYRSSFPLDPSTATSAVAELTSTVSARARRASFAAPFPLRSVPSSCFSRNSRADLALRPMAAALQAEYVPEGSVWYRAGFWDSEESKPAISVEMPKGLTPPDCVYFCWMPAMCLVMCSTPGRSSIVSR